ncbi:MAG: PD-(D/E)XK nuclease family protein, partial [Nitrosospira sp.]|nr:PD-(D/E)XK nuclease family protein [Nitrosospira sp.]
MALDSQNSTVVVTPNQRLSLVLKRKFNDAQRSRALTSWNSANISPFHVFIERAYETASYSPQEMKLPILLSPTQERALWENIIRHSDVGVSLLSISETAQIVCEAWQIGHAWQLIDQLEEFYLSDDSKTFQDWAERYKRITRNNRQIDNARLYDLIGSLWEAIEIKRPSCLICYGFDALTPQQQTLLIKIRIAGCEVMWTESQSQSQSQS